MHPCQPGKPDCPISLGYPKFYSGAMRRIYCVRVHAWGGFGTFTAGSFVRTISRVIVRIHSKCYGLIRISPCRLPLARNRRTVPSPNGTERTDGQGTRNPRFGLRCLILCQLRLQPWPTNSPFSFSPSSGDDNVTSVLTISLGKEGGQL